MMLGTGIIGGGTFPTIVGALASADNAFSTTHTLDFPGGTTQSGELLLALIGAAVVVTPAGWTLIAGDTFMGVYSRVADGLEGASLTFSTSSNRVAAGVIYRITGYAGAPEAAASPSFGTGANPDPPSLAASWGTKKTLWIAGAGASRTLGTPTPSVSAYPAGFIDGIDDTAFPGSGGSVCAGAAVRFDDTTDTIDPGAFTLNTAVVNWSTVTIAIRGA